VVEQPHAVRRRLGRDRDWPGANDEVVGAIVARKDRLGGVEVEHRPGNAKPDTQEQPKETFEIVHDGHSTGHGSRPERRHYTTGGADTPLGGHIGRRCQLAYDGLFESDLEVPLAGASGWYLDTNPKRQRGPTQPRGSAWLPSSLGPVLSLPFSSFAS